MELERKDSGKSVRLSIGEVLTIRLPENPMTGYRWQATQMPEPILDAEPPIFVPTSELAGASGWRIFRFRGVQVGKSRLALNLVRGWEEGIGIDSFVVGAEVR
jgi:inhibitor of cysteine peptidase